MDEREEFVKLALSAGANVSDLCRRFGVSRSNGRKWLARYREQGRAGLCERSRRPRRSPLRTEPATEAEVLRIREESNNAWGGRKIAKVMERTSSGRVPSASTITEILRRHGKLQEHEHEHPGPFKRFEKEQPNELWQMDFKGHFALAEGRCHPLTVLDDHSRYALGLQACRDQQDTTVRQRLTMLFRCYGLPFAMLMDNGAPWGDSGLEPFTRFTAWLMRLGIRVTHGRPYHPQTQGKDERFHRTLKREVLDQKSFHGLAECQQAFDRWRRIYNHERPHEALQLDTPSSRYRASPRSFPETLPAIEYWPGDTVRKVDAAARISFKNRSWKIGKAFRGQQVALRQTGEDGLFHVYFCAQKVGVIDLRAPDARGYVDIAAAMTTNPRQQ
jgi:transposase InsO family protein